MVRPVCAVAISLDGNQVRSHRRNQSRKPLFWLKTQGNPVSSRQNALDFAAEKTRFCIKSRPTRIVMPVQGACGGTRGAMPGTDQAYSAVPGNYKIWPGTDLAYGAMPGDRRSGERQVRGTKSAVASPLPTTSYGATYALVLKSGMPLPGQCARYWRERTERKPLTSSNTGRVVLPTRVLCDAWYWPAYRTLICLRAWYFFPLHAYGGTGYAVCGTDTAYRGASTNGKFLAVGSDDCYVDLYDVLDNYEWIGTCQGTVCTAKGFDSAARRNQRQEAAVPVQIVLKKALIQGHMSGVLAVDWSTDSKQLHSDDRGKNHMFWDVESTKEILVAAEVPC
eukprot:563848-Rhodomonas_salina.2